MVHEVLSDKTLVSLDSYASDLFESAVFFIMRSLVVEESLFSFGAMVLYVHGLSRKFKN